MRNRDSRNGWKWGDECCPSRGLWQAVGSPGFWKPQIRRDPAPTLSLETDRPPPTPSPWPWSSHRQVHKTQGGDDATDEADEEGAERQDHQLGNGAQAHSSSERRVLDVHLGRAGRAGGNSVLSQSSILEELT